MPNTSASKDVFICDNGHQAQSNILADRLRKLVEAGILGLR